MLYLKLFGGFQLSIDGQPITSLTPRHKEILAYLVLKYPGTVSRQSLAVQFWAESSDSQALTNLRGHLLKLQREIPQLENYLNFEGPEISWQKGCAVSADVLDFQRYLRNAATSDDESTIHRELERAAELYEGGLFPDCFGEWIVEDRERIRDQFVDLLERLGVLHESLRLYKEAVLYVKRLQRFEPQREESYRLLMRLHATLGQIDEIHKVYQQCEQILQREFRAPPSKPTQELYQRLLQSGETLRQTPVDRIPLVGRQLEWQQLQKRWTQVLSSGTHCLLLSGELGIGKSRLLEEMTDTIGRRGFHVLTATCSYFDQQTSYAPIVRWLQSDLLRANLRTVDNCTRQEISPLLSDNDAGSSSTFNTKQTTAGLQRTHMHQALTRLFLVKRTPLLLVIDNLHWCDVDTLDWLQSFLIHDRRAPVMLLGAVCGAYPHQAHLANWQSTLRQHGLLSEISLPVLKPDETQQLAENATGEQVSTEEALLLHRLSRGNPAHILDLLHGQTKLPTRRAEQLQQSYHAVFDLLLAHLPISALELVESAAVAGSTVTITQLLRFCQKEEEELMLALSLLVDSCILRELGDDTYQFTSYFLPQMVLSRMSNTKKRYWESRLRR